MACAKGPTPCGMGSRPSGNWGRRGARLPCVTAVEGGSLADGRGPELSAVLEREAEADAAAAEEALEVLERKHALSLGA